MFVIRTCRQLLERHLFEPKELTKIGTTYLALVAAFAIFLPRTYLSIWISVFAPLLIIGFAVYFFIQRRTRQFREALCEALALVSLKMKSGRSFRQAYSEVTGESEARMRAKLSEIGSVVVFSQQATEIGVDPFIAEVVDELQKIDRQPHAASRRLATFREKLRIEDDFRRRSGQVLARIRAQSFIMTGLYAAMAIFIAWKFGWRENLRLFLFSMLLFAIGSVWIWKGGRHKEWKV